MRKININKKLFGTSFLILAIIAGIVQSCQKNDEILDISKDGIFFKGKHFTKEELNNEAQEISEKDILKVLNKRYGISKVINISKKSSESIKSKLKTLNIDDNDYQITEYEFEKSNDCLYIVQNIKIPNEYQVIKTFKENGKIKILNKTWIYHDKLISNCLKINHNKSTKPNEFSLNSLIKLNTANAELCQQEGTETASQCSSREYDEFTSDYVGFVAFWTNPGIAVLIAVMCSC